MFILTKIDEEKRLVFARAAQEVPDKTNEIMDYETAKPAFEKWSKAFEDASGGLSKGNVRVMHGKTVAGKVTDMTFNDPDKAIDVCLKIVDDAEWAKCLEGCYTGLSMGGGYAKTWKDPANPLLKRYTPRISELSLVDSPCIPTARFFDLQKADGTVEKVEFAVAKKIDEIDALFDKFGDEVGELALAKSSPVVNDVMHRWKSGSLKSSSGAKVTDRKQAIAIALSEEQTHPDGEEDKAEKLDIPTFEDMLQKQPISFEQALGKSALTAAVKDIAFNAVDQTGGNIGAGIGRTMGAIKGWATNPYTLHSPQIVWNSISSGRPFSRSQHRLVNDWIQRSADSWGDTGRMVGGSLTLPIVAAGGIVGLKVGKLKGDKSSPQQAKHVPVAKARSMADRKFDPSKHPRGRAGEFASKADIVGSLRKVDEFNSSAHPRAGRGSSHGGEFTSKGSRPPALVRSVPADTKEHQSYQDSSSGYSALTSSVIPEQRGGPIGEGVAAAAGGTIGASLAVSPMLREAHPIVGFATHDAGALARGVGKLGGKIVGSAAGLAVTAPAAGLAHIVGLHSAGDAIAHSGLARSASQAGGRGGVMIANAVDHAVSMGYRGAGEVLTHAVGRRAGLMGMGLVGAYLGARALAPYGQAAGEYIQPFFARQVAMKVDDILRQARPLAKAGNPWRDKDGKFTSQAMAAFSVGGGLAAGAAAGGAAAYFGSSKAPAPPSVTSPHVDMPTVHAQHVTPISPGTISIGDKVHHQDFGTGTVRGISAKKLTVDFKDAPHVVPTESVGQSRVLPRKYFIPNESPAKAVSGRTFGSHPMVAKALRDANEYMKPIFSATDKVKAETLKQVREGAADGLKTFAKLPVGKKVLYGIIAAAALRESGNILSQGMDYFRNMHHEVALTPYGVQIGIKSGLGTKENPGPQHTIASYSSQGGLKTPTLSSEHTETKPTEYKGSETEERGGGVLPEKREVVVQRQEQGQGTKGGQGTIEEHGLVIRNSNPDPGRLPPYHKSGEVAMTDMSNQTNRFGRYVDPYQGPGQGGSGVDYGLTQVPGDTIDYSSRPNAFGSSYYKFARDNLKQDGQSLGDMFRKNPGQRYARMQELATGTGDTVPETANHMTRDQKTRLLTRLYAVGDKERHDLIYNQNNLPAAVQKHIDKLKQRGGFYSHAEKASVNHLIHISKDFHVVKDGNIGSAWTDAGERIRADVANLPVNPKGGTPIQGKGEHPGIKAMHGRIDERRAQMESAVVSSVEDGDTREDNRGNAVPSNSVMRRQPNETHEQWQNRISGERLLRSQQRKGFEGKVEAIVDLAKKYSPNQPRVPKGTAGGGEFAGDGGFVSTTASDKANKRSFQKTVKGKKKPPRSNLPNITDSVGSYATGQAATDLIENIVGSTPVGRMARVGVLGAKMAAETAGYIAGSIGGRKAGEAIVGPAKSQNDTHDEFIGRLVGGLGGQFLGGAAAGVTALPTVVGAIPASVAGATAGGVAGEQLGAHIGHFFDVHGQDVANRVSRFFNNKATA